MNNDKHIIIKPMIGEKATRFIESQRKYVFQETHIVEWFRGGHITEVMKSFGKSMI